MSSWRKSPKNPNISLICKQQTICCELLFLISGSRWKRKKKIIRKKLGKFIQNYQWNLLNPSKFRWLQPVLPRSGPISFQVLFWISQILFQYLSENNLYYWGQIIWNELKKMIENKKERKKEISNIKFPLPTGRLTAPPFGTRLKRNTSITKLPNPPLYLRLRI